MLSVSTSEQTVTGKPIKRGRGRPSLTGTPGATFHIRLPQHVADYLKKLGEGSISRGIIFQTTGGPMPGLPKARLKRVTIQK